MNFFSPERWQWIVPIVEFVVHIIVASVLFMLVALAGLALVWFVKWLESEGMDSNFVVAMIGVEYLLFMADIVLLVTFVFKASVKL